MIPVYRRRRDLMLRTLEERMPPGTTWTEPDGGLVPVVTRAGAASTPARCCRARSRNKVAYVPGAPFWVNRDVRNTMRLNFSNATEEKIVDRHRPDRRPVARSARSSRGFGAAYFHIPVRSLAEHAFAVQVRPKMSSIVRSTS